MKGYTESEMEVQARYQRALEKYRDRIERIILVGSVARGGCTEEYIPPKIARGYTHLKS